MAGAADRQVETRGEGLLLGFYLTQRLAKLCLTNMACFLDLTSNILCRLHFNKKQNSICDEGRISFLIAHLEILWHLVNGHFLNKALI